MTQLKHLQDRPLDWQAASDEAHIQALYNPAPFPDPAYMGYLQRERPQTITKYLQLWQAEGNYLSAIARKRLGGR